MRSIVALAFCALACTEGAQENEGATVLASRTGDEGPQPPRSLAELQEPVKDNWKAPEGRPDPGSSRTKEEILEEEVQDRTSGFQRLVADSLVLTVVEGEITSVQSDIVFVKGQETPTEIATRNIVKVERQWGKRTAATVEFWSRGGEYVYPDGQHAKMTISTEFYGKVGDRIVVALAESDLFDVSPKLSRAHGGRGGTLRLGAANNPDTQAANRIRPHLDQTRGRSN